MVWKCDMFLINRTYHYKHTVFRLQQNTPDVKEGASNEVMMTCRLSDVRTLMVAALKCVHRGFLNKWDTSDLTRSRVKPHHSTQSQIPQQPKASDLYCLFKA